MACRATAQLLRAGVNAFSPIVHSHGVAMHGGIDPLAHDIWLPADLPMMQGAVALAVWQEDGWKDSYGIGQEIAQFISDGKPVIMLDPTWDLHEIKRAVDAAFPDGGRA